MMMMKTKTLLGLQLKDHGAHLPDVLPGSQTQPNKDYFRNNVSQWKKPWVGILGDTDSRHSFAANG